MASMSGSMTWDLIANADKYVAGMNKAAAATRGMESRQKAMTRQTKMLQSAVALVSAAAIVRFGSQSVKAYRDAEKAQAKLAQSFAKFPKLADTTIGAMRSMNAELQKSTIYDDDVTAAMQARLAMYDLTGQQLRELTPLVMDYASATGQDLASAGDAIGKSLLGNTRALKAVGISYKATGDRARDYAAIQSMLSEKVGGFAESEGKTAAGQAAILANAYGELQESVGEALLPALQALMDVARPMLDTFNELPKPAKTAAVVIGAVGTAALVATPRIIAMRTALQTTGAAGATAGVGMGKFGKAMKGVGVGAAAAAVGLPVISSIVDAIGDKMFGATTNAEDLAYQLENMGSSGIVGRFGKEFHAIGQEIQALASPGLAQRMEDFWGTMAGNGGGEGRQRVLDELAAIDAVLADMVNSGNADEAARQVREIMANTVAFGGSAADVSALLPGYNEALSGTGRSFAEVGGEADGAADEVKTFREEMEALNAPTRDLTQAQMGLIENAAELAKGLRENGKSFDMSTEAGRKNLGSLLDTVEGIEDLGAAIEAKTGSQDKARAAILRERDALIKNLEATGLAGDKAQRLVDKYLKVPAATKAAADGIDDITNAINRMPSTKTVTINIKGRTLRLPGEDAPVRPASGGLIVGPGTGTSDSIPAMVSNGEYVVKASSVARYGVGMFHALNAERFASGGLVGGSSGGRRRKTWDRGVRDSVVSANGLFDAFDMDAYAEAMERVKAATEGLADARKSLVSAEDDVAAARRAVNQAGSPEEQARAEQQLAEALRARASAEGDVAQAQMEQKQATASMRGTKLTSDNVVAKFRQRAQKLDKFRRDLQTLRKRGLSRAIIQELIDAGIEEGGAMAAALVAGNDIGKLNNIYGDITRDSRGIARAGVLTDAPGSSGGSGGSGGGGTTGSTGESVAVALSFEKADRPIVLKVEGEQVWKALLKLKKAKGGASLGLS